MGSFYVTMLDSSEFCQRVISSQNVLTICEKPREQVLTERFRCSFLLIAICATGKPEGAFHFFVKNTQAKLYSPKYRHRFSCKSKLTYLRRL